MDKAVLKTFAINSRLELIERVKLQARKIGITEDNIKQITVESSDAIYIDGRQLSDVERKQRDNLIAQIKKLGFDQVIEEAAYTWFNRFIALRFMEVNGYLPTNVRVLSSEVRGNIDPDMIREALSLNLPLDKQYVYELKIANKTDELFKYLIQLHCNDLNRYLPFMFKTVEDYLLILFPEGLLRTESFLRKMTNIELIPEHYWENVEIIGWLYQYYIAEENERVIRGKKRYKAEEIPFATQLFTPEWIVRYMVQNSLGRYWIEAHPEHRHLKNNWEYFLENTAEKEILREKLARFINHDLKIEQIKCFDPSMGSGHVLVYMFDILYEIYRESGYIEREIPRLIIENNLYGLDIDERAYQLASFAIVMKALQYNRRFLRSIERDGLKLNLTVIEETNYFTDDDITFLAGQSSGPNFTKMKQFIEQFTDAKSIGSLLKVVSYDAEFLKGRLHNLEQQLGNVFEIERQERLVPLFKQLIKQATIMTNEYDVFVTNPPYAGRRYLTKAITKYIDEHYSDVKYDLFSSFIEYSFRATKENGQIGFMTPYVWMFIKSYEKLRDKIISERNISSLIQLEYSSFDGATVPICTFTMRNYNSGTAGEYVRLADFRGAINQPIKTLAAVKDSTVSYRYTFHQENFKRIPGHPIAYWVSENVINIFDIDDKITNIGEARKGLVTMDNNRFLRFWYEVDIENCYFEAENSEMALNSGAKWHPLSKGGKYRKWYGNRDYVINWFNDGKELKDSIIEKYKGGSYTKEIRNERLYFKPMLSWSGVSSGNISFRLNDKGFIFDTSGPAVFPTSNKYHLLGYLNSSVVTTLLKFISPTLSFLPGDIAILPLNEAVLTNEIVPAIVKENVAISKSDWDSFETSWDFTKHPFLKFPANTIEKSFEGWSQYTSEQFNKLKENEERLNKIFIDIYGLQAELSPEVAEENVTINQAELVRDVKSFISYAVGCMFGRYSLDKDGIVFAGGQLDEACYETFPANKNNILLILSSSYFEDDIVEQFVNFVEKSYGAKMLEQNLTFLAEAIGKRNNETSREALRRYFLRDFYKDHVQTYNKRPIYWLFSSGRERAFNCLIYMHRHDETTLARMRTNYLHRVQTRYEGEREDLLAIINNDATAKEIRDAKRDLKAIERKIAELKNYDEQLHHLADRKINLDLDDGVKVNYDKFKDLVVKI